MTKQGQRYAVSSCTETAQHQPVSVPDCLLDNHVAVSCSKQKFFQHVQMDADGIMSELQLEHCAAFPFYQEQQ